MGLQVPPTPMVVLELHYLPINLTCLSPCSISPYVPVCVDDIYNELHDSSSSLRDEWRQERVESWSSGFNSSLPDFKTGPGCVLDPNRARLPGDICGGCKSSRARLIQKLRPLVEFVKGETVANEASLRITEFFTGV